MNLNMNLYEIVNIDDYPLADRSFRDSCRSCLERDGVLVLKGFLNAMAIQAIAKDGETRSDDAYFTTGTHNIYLSPSDEKYPSEHPRNREVVSSKGCITTDQIAADSELRTLYDSPDFREFLCAVLDEDGLFEYADALSSINLHYAGHGQELGWHFDNSSFAITLMIQHPQAGGEFQYVRDVRNSDRGDMNYTATGDVLDGKVSVNSLSMPAGTLVLFRGRDSMHRVTPVIGNITRMLVVLAYNTEPGIALSESARMTFYGRLR